MSRQRIWILALIVVFAGVWIWIHSQPGVAPHSLVPARPSPSPSVTPTGMPPVKASPSASSLVPQTSEELPATLTPPSLQTLRDEVAQNPHQTPPSLLEFARNLGRKMDVAKGSEAEAERFFGEIEDCARPQQNTAHATDTIPPQVQSLCLSAAEQLAHLYPAQLGERNRKVQNDAAQEAKRLRDALKKFE